MNVIIERSYYSDLVPRVQVPKGYEAVKSFLQSDLNGSIKFMDDAIEKLSKIINLELPVYIRRGNICSVVMLNDRTVIEDMDLTETECVIETPYLLELVKEYKSAYIEDQKNNKGPSP